MGRTKLTFAAAAAAMLIALPAGWYFGSPWWTLWRIREAARAGDSARLASYVDYRAIMAQWEADARMSWAGLLGMLRSDTPQNRQFMDVMRRQTSRRLTEGAAKEEITPWLSDIPIGFWGGGHSSYRPYIVHQGIDRFEVRDEGSSLEFGPVLTFRRRGLGWRLEAVRFGQQ